MEKTLYRLKISGIKSNSKDTVGSSVVTSSPDLLLKYNSTTQTELVDLNNCECKLQEFSYTKAIYQPGKILFTIQLIGCDKNTISDICSQFKGKEVELSCENNENFCIGKLFYIFSVQIVKSKESVYVTILAFDPLKYLTLDSYCKAYTGKKFMSDILFNKDLWPDGMPQTLKNKLESVKEDLDEFNNIHYQIDKIRKEIDKKEGDRRIKAKELTAKLNELRTKEENALIVPYALFLTYWNNNGYTEFIQPYLVQYNESVFDFLVRVSNRCGEFFYCEKGLVHLGWKKETETDADGNTKDVKTIIKNYVSVNFSQEIDTAWKENSVSGMHHDYTANQTKKDIANAGKIYDSGLASDENLVSIPPKGKYTQWADFALWPGCYLINMLTEVVNAANVAEAITNSAFKTGATSASCGLQAKSVNDKYEESHFMKGTYIDERKNGNRIHPFCTSDSNKSIAANNYVTFSLEFYEVVRKGIEANERSRIRLALGAYFYPLSLGSLIEFDGKTYIVVLIDGRVNNDAEDLNIEAIPYVGKCVFPPAAPVSPIREAKAQRAFITHNIDPLKMNRVRVRYPWQGKTENVDDLKTSEDSTPWIRMALPMASDGSGFNFLPQIGDEAIINYENGNIEKPYVEGMLFTRAAKEEESTVPYAFKRDAARVISSVNGHSIIFSDPPTSTNVFNGLFPLWKTLSSFAPTVFKGDLADYNKKAMGGIELTDEHGLYSISMSSDKRAISIDSPLGKVDINAFTGITISAPNGNVRIEGKNIDIVAGNNLSISSGNNIASHFWHMKDSKWGEGGRDFLGSLAKGFVSKFEVIDMGLIRTIIETFVRPCGGTMLIKSNRYLCMEAGKGEAQIAGRQTVKQLNIRDTKNLAFICDQIDINKVSIPYNSNQIVTNRIPLHINNLLQAIHAASDAFQATNDFLIREKNAYIDAYTNINSIFGSRDFITNGNQIEDFAHLYPNNINNFNGFQMNNASRPTNDKKRVFNGMKFNSIQTYLNELNKHALNIKNKRLTPDKIWNNFINVYIQDNVLKNYIGPDQRIRTDIDTLFAGSVTDTYLTNNGPQNLNVAHIRKLVVDTLDILIGMQAAAEMKDAAYNSADRIAQPLSFPQNYTDDREWEDYYKAIKYEDSNLSIKTLGLDFVKTLTGYNKLSGILDSYIWDSNEDSGKILFSDKAGETLNFNNKEVHYYKKSEGDPLESLKNILSGIG